MKNFMNCGIILAVGLCLGCGSDTSKSNGQSALVDAGGAGGAAGADGGSEAMDASPEEGPDSMMAEAGGGPACSDEGDKCPAACAWLADCAVAEDACPGLNSEARDGVYQGCLESCAEIPAQAILVCNQSTCEETLNFVRGANEEFDAACSGEGGGASPELNFAEGDPLPEFTANDQSGESVSLSDFSGGFLIVMLNANEWCPPCVNVAEQTEALWRRLDAEDDRYRVRFVELLLDGPSDELSTQMDAGVWADNYGLTYSVLHGAEVRTYVNQLGIPGFPFMLLVDPLQRISAYQVGWDENEFTLDVPAVFEAFLLANPDWQSEPAPNGG